MIDDEVSMYPMVPFTALVVPLQSGIVPDGGRDEIFQLIFTVFLVLGTTVGVVVIGYMLYNGYKYRDRGDQDDDGIDRPELGELPEGGGGGRKLALSLLLSAAIVISLITWTYFALVDVERTQPAEAENALNVQVEGFQFGWAFVYPNGNTSDTLRVPEDRMVKLTVTSRDVFHNFGIPAFKMKTDAIPGQTTDTWFRPNETGTYQAQCFELCGAGHSAMNANVSVMESGAYEQWYANTTPANTTSGNATGNNTTATDASATADNATAANNGTTAA
jgi:cytochrome c oxidase subunit 2